MVRHWPYLFDLLHAIRQLSGIVGPLFIFFSLPGMLLIVWPSDLARNLPWLPVVLSAFSSVLLIAGIALLWRGLREALRFRPWARRRFGSRT